MASIHNRKMIAALIRELKEKDSMIEELRQKINSLETMIGDVIIDSKEE